MKRLLLSAFAVMIASATFAQNSLTIPSIDDFVWGSIEDNLIQAEGTVENTNGSGPIDVRVQRITIDTVPGSQNYFCWEQCYEPPTSISPTAMTIDPGQRVDQFYADYKPNGQQGISTLAYCFYNDANEADSVCVTVRFSASPVGIQDVFLGNQSGISESYPNPAKSVAKINYALSAGWNKAELMIYSMLGAQVRKINLLEDQGTLKLNVSDLPSGMYFYTLMVDDKSIATKKMLVTK
ncbi:MAG: T9SS type A sorting domain-containing protein [Flavobacteriales bacterium]|nr:T9SS type A sorting domain-containing protein [Flavobacteriales bacterium]MCB9204557.1 T9SS type A sorting domain-containing protein [Flavobacteriales bacterium]